MWLGDGSKISTTITTIDKEVVQYLETYADNLDMNVAYSSNVEKHPDYRIIKGVGKNNILLK